MLKSVTVKLTAFEVPPPGAGLVTVTFKVPAMAMSEARMAAVSCVALTKVVARALPLKFTIDVDTKPVPFTVRVKDAPPTVALVGEIVVIVDTGLFTVNVTAFEVPPPGAGLVTVTFKVPAMAMSEARMTAVSCVALTRVVARALAPKFTAEVETKPVPFTVKVKAAPPAMALLGGMVVIVGTGLFTVNVTALEVPPLGAGLVTVKLNVPAMAMSEARMVAVSCVALTNVVVLAFPLKLTVEVLRKFVPFTVKVKAAPPAVALAGEMLMIVGGGKVSLNTVPQVPLILQLLLEKPPYTVVP
jgi:hypothetical protein